MNSPYLFSEYPSFLCESALTKKSSANTTTHHLAPINFQIKSDILSGLGKSCALSFAPFFLINQISGCRLTGRINLKVNNEKCLKVNDLPALIFVGFFPNYFTVKAVEGLFRYNIIKWRISSWLFTKLDNFLPFIYYMVGWPLHNKKTRFLLLHSSWKTKNFIFLFNH